jgi:hypothetical protein
MNRSKKTEPVRPQGDRQSAKNPILQSLVHGLSLLGESLLPPSKRSRFSSMGGVG